MKQTKCTVCNEEAMEQLGGLCPSCYHEKEMEEIIKLDDLNLQYAMEQGLCPVTTAKSCSVCPDRCKKVELEYEEEMYSLVEGPVCNEHR